MYRAGMLAGLFAGAFIVTACEPERREAEMPGTTTMPGGTAVTETPVTPQAATFDQEFIDHMAAHLKFGVDLAQVGKDKAQHEELKVYSENLTNTWKAEVDRMKEW